MAGGKVSMPPRRSCFALERGERQVVKLSFNATTAFLLRLRDPGSRDFGRLSMPPRRSCFRELNIPLPQPIEAFNATTAFLLL